LKCKVPEGRGTLQQHERVDLHDKAWYPSPDYLDHLEGTIALVDSDKGIERAICCDREDLERWKGAMVDLGGQGRNEL